MRSDFRELKIVAWTLMSAAAGAGLLLAVDSARQERPPPPVVIDWTATPIRRGDGATVLDVFGDKVRPECRYVSQAMTLHNSAGVGREVGYVPLNDVSPGSTRPAGKQWFGLWEIATTPDTPAGWTIQGVAVHICRPGGEVLTPIGGPGFVVPPMWRD